MFRMSCCTMLALVLVTAETRAEGPFGPVVKLTADQRKVVEAGVRKRLLMPDRATISGLSAQKAKNGIVVCGRLEAQEYHPEVRRRVFMGGLHGTGDAAVFEIFGPLEPYMSAISEADCKARGLL